MAPTDRVQKKWITKQLRHAASLKTLAGVRRFQRTILEMLKDEKDTKSQSLTAGNITYDQVVEIFGLQRPVKWELSEEIHDIPRFLTYSLAQLEKALYDKNSEAYSRIAIDYLIVACMVKHRDLLSKLPTEDPTATIVDQATNIAEPSHFPPATLSARRSTFQPEPIKVFQEMALSVNVKKGDREWHISGIADWAMGYGDRATLEDGKVLLAVEAKRPKILFDAEEQLLAYLATIRQLRIQAKKENVITQGFYSDGRFYRFMCIRNNGAVMMSRLYDTIMDGDFRSVFNFLLGMLITAVESSPNTSPMKPGLQQDKRIQNFDEEVFVEVFEDVGMDNISIPTIYHDEVEEDEWPDIIIEE